MSDPAEVRIEKLLLVGFSDEVKMGVGAELLKSIGNAVRQLSPLAGRSDVFDRVEFGRIGRQPTDSSQATTVIQAAVLGSTVRTEISPHHCSR